MESGLATAEGSNPSEINMDQMVSVKIDGVTSQITIRDAVNGYATKQKMMPLTRSKRNYSGTLRGQSLG